MYINQDPIGLMGGNELYSYVHDPNNWVDILGLAKRNITGGQSKRRNFRNFFENIKNENGSVFGNKDNTLPKSRNGKPITYTEYDYNPAPSASQRANGATRGKRRIVVGSDGKAYYTNDHYTSFVEIKCH